MNYIITLTLLPLLFLSRGCAKDSEEVYDENDTNMEIHYSEYDTVTKDMAIENWEAFLKQSQDLIDITEANISSLEYKIEQSDDQAEINELQNVCNNSNLKLLKLKAKRIRRNKEFTAELKNYDSSDSSIQQANEAFKKQFKEDMVELNIQLERILEKSRTGFYK